MVLQNIIFPSFETCVEDQMYFRASENVEYSCCYDCIKLPENESLLFDTYFNSFSAEKWFKYTNAENIELTVRISGKVRLSLFRKEKYRDEILSENCGEYICSTDDDTPAEFTFTFRSSSLTGMYCFRLDGISEESYFYGGSYNSDIAVCRNVKIAVDICTFRRERYITENLELMNRHFLNNKGSVLYDNLEIFVSDNAGTLDTQSISSDKIHIFRNKNVGGAGGFTRGMIEIGKVREKKNITHILLMDDDIRIEPEAIFRTFTMLSCLKEQYKDAYVGGAMLRLDRRWFQVESGAAWNGGDIVSLKHGLDLRELDACLYNELEEKTQYNAWWYCAFPADNASDNNLPLPIFIRGDDVEYGLRNMKHIILMNGICVWHEPFENKYSSFLYYYILRNRLIDNALHNMILPTEVFTDILWRQVNDEIRIYRYKNAELLMRGVEDFLRGVDWLYSQDGEKLHKDVMASGYKLKYIDDIDENVRFDYPMYETSLNDVPSSGLIRRAVNHFTHNGTMLKPLRGYNIVPVIGVCHSSVYRTATILNYDLSSRKCFVTARSPEEAKKCLRRLKKLIAQVKKDYRKVSADYAANGHKLMSLDFWNKYLEIDEKR